MALVTLKQVNDALRLGLTGDAPDYVTDDRTPDILLKIEQASDIVLDFCNLRPASTGESVIPDQTNLIGVGRLLAGAATVVLPDYAPILFEEAIGSGVSLTEGGESLLVELSPDHYTYVEAEISTLQSWGRYVTFAYQRNDLPLVELGRWQINSSVPVLVRVRVAAPNLVTGDTIKCFVSSDFEYAETVWTGGRLMLVQSLEEIDVLATDEEELPWTPTTAPPRVNAATILTVRALLDDSEESTVWLAGLSGVGGAKPDVRNPIAALLWRLRQPVMA